MSFRAERAVRTVSIHRSAVGEAQDASYLVVQFFCSDFAFTNQFQVRICQVIIVVSVAGSVGQSVGPASELHIESIGDGFLCVMNASPVRDDNTVETPFAFQYVVQEVLVMATVLILVQVVGTHDGPGISFLDGCFEGGEVDFVEGTVVYDDVGRMAVYFLVVECIMFHTGSHAVLLDALHIGNYHLSGQIRVFAHILEIASIQWRTVDVYTGAQQDRFIPIAGFFTDAFAI